LLNYCVGFCKDPDGPTLEDVDEVFLDENGEIWAEDRLDPLWSLLGITVYKSDDYFPEYSNLSYGSYTEEAMDRLIDKLSPEAQVKIRPDADIFTDYAHR